MINGQVSNQRWMVPISASLMRTVYGRHAIFTRNHIYLFLSLFDQYFQLKAFRDSTKAYHFEAYIKVALLFIKYFHELWLDFFESPFDVRMNLTIFGRIWDKYLKEHINKRTVTEGKQR